MGQEIARPLSIAAREGPAPLMGAALALNVGFPVFDPRVQAGRERTDR
jgi:hypothetical protein